MSTAKYSKTASSAKDALEYVPLQPFQTAFQRLHEREGLTVGEVAHRMGADTELTRRRLAGKPWSDRAKTLKSGEVRVYPGRPPQRVRYEVAVDLCRALEQWPIDMGV